MQGRVCIRFDWGLLPQLHVQAFYELNKRSHPCYEACRSLGLAGSLRQDEQEAAVLPLGVQMRVAALRFFVAFLLFIQGFLLTFG